MIEEVEFYEFPYNGRIARIYKKEYIELRVKQLESKQPDEFLDAFRRYMGLKK